MQSKYGPHSDRFEYNYGQNFILNLQFCVEGIKSFWPMRQATHLHIPCRHIGLGSMAQQNKVVMGDLEIKCAVQMTALCCSSRAAIYYFVQYHNLKKLLKLVKMFLGVPWIMSLIGLHASLSVR